jgi:hypothetical protein
VISPEDIRDRARKLWATGQPLRALLSILLDQPPALVGFGATQVQPFFPCLVPFRKPTAQEWLDHFADLRAAGTALEAQSKGALGAGYTITFREAAHRKLGRLRVPERITFECIEDLAVCAGESDTLRRFRNIVRVLEEREPRLLQWLADRPSTVLEVESDLVRLLDTVAHFQAHPRPNRYARELGIGGVDSKFIEGNRSLLSEWLGRLLPADAIDGNIRGLADHGFERRYGLRFEEAQVRFRWLDTQRAPLGLADLSVPLSQFARYAPACGCTIVVENKINFLALPPHPNTLAIFGSGYAIDLLKSISWLERQPLHYWGDLDTHGFALLNRLRGHFPHTRSLLMDRDTLIAYRDLWTEELSGTRVLQDLPGLDPDERSLYDDLRNDRLGDRVRLEQERIPYAMVERAILNL